MKAFARALAVCAAALFFPACLPFALFEDVGSDPHPPSIVLLGMAVQPPEPAEGEPEAQPVFLPPDGFRVNPLKAFGNKFVLRVRFTDAGGDVVALRLRDRDGDLSLDASPEAPEVDTDGDGTPETLEAPDFLPGTSGIFDFRDISFDVNQQGPHRIEVWAEDSHDSRSEKSEFTIEIDLFR